MKQSISYLAALALGVGIGFGISTMISKPKIEKSQREFEQFQAQMKTDKAKADEIAANTIARKDREIENLNDVVKNTLSKLSTIQTTSGGKTTPAPATGTTQPQTILNPAVEQTPAGTAGATKTIVYTVQEGDSFWVIAENELGDGLRYKEIIELNPPMTEKQTLKPGMKIKLPAE